MERFSTMRSRLESRFRNSQPSCEHGDLLGGEKAQAADALELVGDRRRLHQLRMLRAVLELAQLDHRLHVEQPAAPGLQVPAAADLVGQLGLHALADPVHLGRRLLRQGALQDRAAQRDEGLGKPLAARHRTRAQQGLALPDLGVLGVISLEGAQRGDEKTLVPRGTQAGVDLVADALGGGGLEGPAELLGEPYEGRLGLEDPGARRRPPRRRGRSRRDRCRR